MRSMAAFCAVLLACGILSPAAGGGGEAPAAPAAAGQAAGLRAAFLGGAGDETEFFDGAIALAPGGEVIVAGTTTSADFPVTEGAFDRSHHGGPDVFVARLDAGLTAILAATFVGGAGSDLGVALALDGQGRVYVAGTTTSADFPTTPGAYDATANGGRDAFVIRLAADLSSLQAATRLGGSGAEFWPGLAVTDSCVHVAGYTESANFPATSGAYDTSFNGLRDVFVARLDPELSVLQAATFLGGNGREGSDGRVVAALGPGGSVYLTGIAANATFPTTAGSFDTTFNGNGGFAWGGDVFVSRLSPDLASLEASTFLGGANVEWGYGLDVSPRGDVFVCGHTDSPDLPVTAGAYGAALGGGPDAFVARFDADLATLVACTYLGGGLNDNAMGIVADREGRVLVAGYTDAADFPTAGGPWQAAAAGGTEAFVAVMTADLEHLAYATFLGAPQDEWGLRLAAGDDGDAWLLGHTTSAAFPAAAGSFDASYNGGRDCFVACLDLDHVVAGGLQGFYLTPAAGQVEFRWEYTAAADPGWRLTGRAGGCGWEVPWQPVGGGVYTALDRQEALAAGPVVRYELAVGRPEAGWLTLAAREVAVPAAAAAALAVHPNPCNPAATVSFALPAAQAIRIEIHDPAGRRVALLADGTFPSGPHRVVWSGRGRNGAPAASGLYLVDFRAEGRRESAKLILTR